MRRSLFAGVLLIAMLPLAARAQTATFTGSCNPNITVTNGGLTLQASTSASNGTYGCIADAPKYFGLWYFEFTLSGPTGGGTQAISMGLSDNGASQPVLGGTDVNNVTAGSVNFVAFADSSGGASLTWYSNTPTVSQMTLGKTGAIAVDLGSDPPQIWATADVTGTAGYGGGPEWNGSTTASPLVAGTGIPTSGGTGLAFMLPGQAYFPMFSGETYGGNATWQVTFNFGASAFIGTVPSGYSAWNSAGGGAPTPGPTHPMTINVANAPGWQAGTTYAQGDRVLAGPAWSGSAYTSGDSLYLWALTGGYGGSSGTSAAVFNSCPNPANTGGGLLGNYPAQWLSATHVSDGALIWTCLTPVDYTTFTAMADDSATSWAPAAQYHLLDYIVNGGNAYENTSGPNPCTSTASGTGPSGTAIVAITDGTCTWVFQGTVPYSSGLNRIPHQTTYVFGSVTEMNLDWDTTVNLWYGGRGAPSYQDGAGGEADPILLANHSDYVNEYTPACYHGGVSSFPVAIPDCNGSNVGWMITLQPAPGDGFAANMTPGVTPLGYPNSAYGVTFYSDSALTNAAPFPGSALALSDSEINVFGLQFLATQGPAMNNAATSSGDIGTPGNGHPNYEYLNGDILYAGGGFGVVTADASSVISNSTIVYDGTMAGCFGVWSKFNAAIVNDTIIGPSSGASNCSAIMTLVGSAIGITTVPIYNNAIFGWANPWAYGSEGGGPVEPTAVAGNNATDLPSGYTPPANFTWAGNGGTYAAAMLPGVSFYGLSAASQFVNPAPGPGMDLRLLATGSLYGGGAAFTNALGQGLSQTLVPGPDIFGNARPQGARYDIGAYEVSLGCPSPSGTGCH